MHVPVVLPHWVYSGSLGGIVVKVVLGGHMTIEREQIGGLHPAILSEENLNRTNMVSEVVRILSRGTT